MKRVNSKLRAFFSTLKERADIICITRATCLPTSKTQPESPSSRLYKAGGFNRRLPLLTAFQPNPGASGS